jgi:hypothetical protein
LCDWAALLGAAFPFWDGSEGTLPFAYLSFLDGADRSGKNQGQPICKLLHIDHLLDGQVIEIQRFCLEDKLHIKLFQFAC